MAGNKRKNNEEWGQAVIVSFYTLVLGICSLIAAEDVGNFISSGLSPEYRFVRPILFVVLLVCGIFLTFFLQLIVHETGHLVFGLLTGYTLASFRVGSLMWIRQDGKVRLKKLSIAGTGGQCLMVPPEMTNGKIPFVLYNLGGSIFNLIFGSAFLALYLISGDIPVLSGYLMMAGIIGIAFSLMNGIPMRLGTVDNDGYNALSISKSSEAMRAFMIQLKVNGLVSQGVRIKDMPEEWFEVPDTEGMKNSIVAVIGVLAANRLMDLHNFKEAEQLISKLLAMDSAIVGLHRRLLINDLIYCKLIAEGSKRNVDELIDKQQKKFMIAMKSFLSVIRTEYALALLERKDEKKAESIKENFQKAARSFPYPNEVESERELIDVAARAANL